VRSGFVRCDGILSGACSFPSSARSSAVWRRQALPASGLPQGSCNRRHAVLVMGSGKVPRRCTRFCCAHGGGKRCQEDCSPWAQSLKESYAAVPAAAAESRWGRTHRVRRPSALCLCRALSGAPGGIRQPPPEPVPCRLGHATARTSAPYRTHPWTASERVLPARCSVPPRDGDRPAVTVSAARCRLFLSAASNVCSARAGAIAPSILRGWPRERYLAF